jgi:hypothetical protein
MPDFKDLSLTPDLIAFCDKIMSSDALAALILDRLKKGQSASVIRMSDGERAFIAHALGKPQTSFMKDPQWLERYGLTGADQKKVGQALLRAGEAADFLACTISGVFWDCFKVHPYFPRRERFIDQFYWNLWKATDRLLPILSHGPVLVLHRRHEEVCQTLRKLYQIEANGLSLNCWRDHETLLDLVRNRPEHLVLVSGGASGKYFCVRLAKMSGKVVLDAGEGLSDYLK